MPRIHTTFSRWQLWTVLLAAVAMTLGTEATARAQATRGKLISSQLAKQHGLQRAWFARADLNPARNHVVRSILSKDQLLILTSAGLLHAIDAHSGHTLWATSVGNSEYPSLGPATNDQLVALVNGSTLYVLDREDGRPVAEWRLSGAPGAGPAVSKDFVFVPMLNGRIEGFPLDDEQSSPWYYHSSGRALVTPLATPDSVVWVTDRGYLYVAQLDGPSLRFRLESPSEFIAPPTYAGHTIFAISQFGELYAVDERDGNRQWKYATGFPTDREPAIVGDDVYVTSEGPSLHCVEITTGAGQWEAADIVQFAAASEKHVYGVDLYGTIVVVDRQTGAAVDRIPTGGMFRALVNDQTDRMYLISDDGLVLCLHEIGQQEPLYHTPHPGTAASPPVEGAAGTRHPVQPSDESAGLSEGRSTRDEGAPPPAPSPPRDDSFGGFRADGGEAPAEQPEEPAEESPFGVEDDPFAF